MHPSLSRHGVFAHLMLALALTGCGIGPFDRSNQTGAGHLFPLAIGRSWTYALKDLGSFPPCAAGNYTRRVTGETLVDGKTALTLTALCAADGETLLAVTGDLVEERYLDRWVPAIASPLSDGLHWSGGGKNYVAYPVPSVTVKAGAFTSCWKREWLRQWFNIYTIYCPGAGPVVSHFEDTNGNGWDAQLTSKNF